MQAANKEQAGQKNYDILMAVAPLVGSNTFARMYEGNLAHTTQFLAYIILTNMAGPFAVGRTTHVLQKRQRPYCNVRVTFRHIHY